MHGIRMSSKSPPENGSPLQLPGPEGGSLVLGYLFGSVARYRSGDKSPTRRLRDYELVFLLEGGATYHVNGESIPILPGEAVLVRPGFRESWDWDPKRTTRHAYVHFDLRNIPSHWPSPETWPVRVSSLDEAFGPMMRHLLSRVSPRGSPPGAIMPHANPEATVILHGLLDMILSPPGKEAVFTATSYPAPVRAALNVMGAIIDEGSRSGLTLRSLSVHAKVSSKHLCKLFTETLGHAPMETFRLLRLQMGMILIARSDLSVKEIAERAGFDNPLYFTRCFTKVYGTPPTEMRRQLKEGRHPPPGPLPIGLAPLIFW